MLVGSDVDLSATGRSTDFPALGVGSYALANIICYGFGEEIGWRGYALPRLQTDRTATRATLYLALGWRSGTCRSSRAPLACRRWGLPRCSGGPSRSSPAPSC